MLAGITQLLPCIVCSVLRHALRSLVEWQNRQGCVLAEFRALR
jgi:hypothetical protein